MPILIRSKIRKTSEKVHKCVTAGKDLTKLIFRASAAAEATIAGIRIKQGINDLASGDASKAWGHFGDATLRLLGLSAQAVAWLKNRPKCFVAGTPIHTEFGIRPIESISIGDRVWSIDPKIGQWVLADVAQTLRRVSNELVTLLIENGELLTGTPEHPFWVIEGDSLADRPAPTHGADEDWSGVVGRWVNLGDLRIGDVIRTRLGDRSRVIKTEIRPAIEAVYNFEVAGLQNYAIGECGVLTHNYPSADNIPTKVELPPAKVGGEAPKVPDAVPPAKTHAVSEKPVVKGEEVPSSGTVEPVVAPNRVINSLDEIPTNAKGFDAWFDALTPDELAKLYNNQTFRNKIEAQLRNGGSMHEFLMVAEAPHWKKWGVTANQVKNEFAVAIETLNDSLAQGWKHSTGLKGSKSPGSKTAHNALQRIIQESNNLDEFKKNIRVWAERFIKGGFDKLPPGFYN